MASKNLTMATQWKHHDESHDSSIDDSSAVVSVDEEDKDNDEAVVFICGKCRFPIGDSSAWAGSDVDGLQIYLTRVTDNVLVGTEAHHYKPSPTNDCLITDLTCKGCNVLLGMVYVSTPKALDYKRLRFCLQVGRLESYVVGSASQGAPGSPTKQPVTMEYRDFVDQQLIKMKTLVVSMADRLEEIEARLPADYRKLATGHTNHK